MLATLLTCTSLVNCLVFIILLLPFFLLLTMVKKQNDFAMGALPPGCFYSQARVLPWLRVTPGHCRILIKKVTSIILSIYNKDWQRLSRISKWNVNAISNPNRERLMSIVWTIDAVWNIKVSPYVSGEADPCSRHAGGHLASSVDSSRLKACLHERPLHPIEVNEYMRMTFLSPCFFSILPTFVTFCIMSKIASHAQRTLSDMFLRSNWLVFLFFLFSIWKDSLQAFRQLHLCFLWHWESIPDTAQCQSWPSSDIVARSASQRVSLSMTHFETYSLPRCVYANSFIGKHMI